MAEHCQDPIDMIEVLSTGIDTQTREEDSTHTGKEYGFCSPDCKRAFDIAPEQYTKG